MTAGQVAIPETSEELEEMLHDNGRMGEIQDAGQLPDFLRSYQGAWKAKNLETIREHNEAMQVELQNFMRDQAERNGARPPEGFKPGAALALAQGRGPRRERAIARYRGPMARARNVAEFFDQQGLFAEKAPGAAEDIDNSEYAGDLKQFVWAVLKGEHVAKQGGDSELLDKLTAFKGGLARALQVRNATMAERVPSEGGFLVPETLRSEIMALSLEDGVMRGEATVIPMNSLKVPMPSIDDTSHTSTVFGGVSAAWTAEGASLTATAPKFSRVVLEANKLTAFTQIPNELLQDSVTAMDVWFHTFFPQAITFFEDLAFLIGDGVNEPEGLLNCPGAVTVDPGTSATIALADVIAMLCRLWPPSLKRARWVTSPDALKQILGMFFSASGTALAPPAMLGGMQALELPGGMDISDGTMFRMFGIPGRVTEKVPYPGSTIDGSLTLYDPTGYLIGDRQAMQVASSVDYAFQNDEVSYRITERLDGRGWQRTPLAPANGGATLSMTVKLGDTHS